MGVSTSSFSIMGAGGVPGVPVLLGLSWMNLAAVMLAGFAAADVAIIAGVVRFMTGAGPLPDPARALSVAEHRTGLPGVLVPPTAPTAAGGALSLPDGGPDTWH
jgi:hypothetical protein